MSVMKWFNLNAFKSINNVTNALESLLSTWVKGVLIYFGIDRATNANELISRVSLLSLNEGDELFLDWCKRTFEDLENKIPMDIPDNDLV
ncbi:MAG: hypothetical protein GX958_01105, partial [Desulfitobacterium sp.]|nr:hypothetical protein [Desulfitobacterium sp.]